VFQDDALVAARLVTVWGDYCYFAGKKNLYRFDTGMTMTPIGDAVRTYFYGSSGLNATSSYRRSHVFPIDSKDLLAWCIPVTSSYPDKAVVYSPRDNYWVKWTFNSGLARTITAGASYDGLKTTGTETDFNQGTQFGTGAGKFFEFDFTSKNDGSASYPITAFWDSKEFFNPEKGRAELTRWRRLLFEGKGDSVSVYISYDGSSWTLKKTHTLTSGWARYAVDMNQQARLMKIRFYNNTASSTFEIRWFALEYEGSEQN